MSVFAGLNTADATGESAIEIAATTKDLAVHADGYEPCDPQKIRTAAFVPRSQAANLSSPYS
jgi:hypothetical protein